jgi:hypothetical protein
MQVYAVAKVGFGYDSSLRAEDKQTYIHSVIYVRKANKILTVLFVL